jgi:hypothetical protein
LIEQLIREAGPTNVVVEATVVVTAADEGAALALCHDFIADHGLQVVEVEPRTWDPRFPDEWIVELGRVEPLRTGETAEQGLRRVAGPLRDPFYGDSEIRMRAPGVVERLMLYVEDDGVFPIGSFVDLWVRMGDVPNPRDNFQVLEEVPPLYQDLLEGTRYRAVDWDPDPPAGSMTRFFFPEGPAQLYPRIAVLVGESMGWDQETAEAELFRLTTEFPWPPVFGAVDADAAPDGRRVVSMVLGVFPEPASTVADAVLPFFADRQWQEIENGAQRVRMQWRPDEPPDHGFVRLELDVGAALQHTGGRPVRTLPG